MGEGKQKALTAKQRLFAYEYIQDLNASRAARDSGYTKENADVLGPRLAKKPHIAAFIQSLMDKRAEKLGIQAEKTLEEIHRLAHSNIKGLYNDDGTIKHPLEWPDELARAVQSIEVEELFDGHGKERTWVGYTKKVKFWDKPKALELEGRHKKLFTDKVELGADATLADLIVQSQMAREIGK